MVERPILKVHNAERLCSRHIDIDHIPPSAKPSVIALVPKDGSIQDKFNRNCMSCSDSESEGAHKHETGLFITMSRINHHCIGNASHLYLDNRSVKILVADQDIKEGEEITISYVTKKPLDERRAFL